MENRTGNEKTVMVEEANGIIFSGKANISPMPLRKSSMVHGITADTNFSAEREEKQPHHHKRFAYPMWLLKFFCNLISWQH